MFYVQKPLEDKFLVCIIVFFSVAYNFVKFFELDITSFELVKTKNTEKNLSKDILYSFCFLEHQQYQH